jgi:tRNA(Ile)-lysidine synthase TilS/MesJ
LYLHPNIFTGENMIHTEEDDEFSRIEHENAMKTGQPYCFDVYVSPSQRNQVLEEVAKEFDALKIAFGDTAHSFSRFIRDMKK